MKTPLPDRILVRVLIYEGILAKLLLEELGRRSDLTVNIFRGRTIPEETSFEVEIEGPSTRIKDFARWSSERELSTGTSASDITRLGKYRQSPRVT